jgi:hypothetical protein
MLWVRFEPTIPGFERAKTVYALDRAATVIGTYLYLLLLLLLLQFLNLNFFHMTAADGVKIMWFYCLCSFVVEGATTSQKYMFILIISVCKRDDKGYCFLLEHVRLLPRTVLNRAETYRRTATFFCKQESISDSQYTCKYCSILDCIF